MTRRIYTNFLTRKRSQASLERSRIQIIFAIYNRIGAVSATERDLRRYRMGYLSKNTF